MPVDTDRYQPIQAFNPGSAAGMSSSRRTIQVLDLLAGKGALGVRAQICPGGQSICSDPSGEAQVRA